ncbi:conserved oligomeric Golgi complex subunit 3 [Amyelois transitella]|uniref:conserved oligomeric Golgi complex subunit 3 n=1 Tax=Amyelois transitella TaxID=680683 RepID=UPI0029900578|nr:conserved oligomeric Golgi complex subunit 3 [Amyelois transitella]
MDNMSLKEIQSKLLLWEASDNPLAPLTSEQREAILDLEALVTGNYVAGEEDANRTELDESTILSSIPKVDTTYDFLEWYESLSESLVNADDAPYETYYKQLEDRRNECVSLTDQIGATMADLKKLSEQYNLVSNKTNALHMMSEQLLADQNKLSSIGEDIKHKLHYFTQVEHLSQRLNSPTMSVNSDAFFIVLAKIDECLDYMRVNSTFKESHTYLVKYRHLQSRAISLVRSYVTHVLNHATEQVLAPKDEGPTEQEIMDTAYAVYFGKFQAAAPKLKMVITEIEKRAEGNPDYASLLSDLQREYARCRRRVAGAPTAAALAAAAGTHLRDHCTLLRTSCSLLAHACRDECALYAHFFSNPSPALDEYLQSLCNGLYETLRPHIIHINHLETLAELCVILRLELIEEQVNNDPATLGALGAVARALLQDAQERLVFRAHVHLRADVLLYRPARGDLAYPDKLEMMEQIALSIQEQSLKRSDSRNSMTSDISATSQEVAAAMERRAQASPADLHGMWYPAVRRTLAALSRLYRCLERKVFQGLAQEAISLCVQSIDNAAKQISADKTTIDGELFQIKHLLILREQIAPFQVDFIIKETTLDFSNVKNAAYGLIQKPRQIFSLNSNNALLEFLLEGTPMVKEHLLDSRKEVDRQLKTSCEVFIRDATEVLAGPLISFMEKAQAFNPIEQLKSQPWASPEEIAVVVKEAQRRIKAQLAPLQRSMQLYLANKETEFILFRPIRNNVVGFFVQMEQMLNNADFSYEDRLIVACPTPEQVSVFISSASLISHGEPVLPYGKKRKTSTVRKPSVASVQESSDKPQESSKTIDV